MSLYASPLFAPLRPWLARLPEAPDSAALAALAEGFPVRTDNGQSIRFAPPVADGRAYECRIWESGEVETGRATLVAITLHDDGRCVMRNGVNEGLAIREDALHLHVFEQLSIKLRWGFVLADGGRRQEAQTLLNKIAKDAK